jgi:hypothetical protein
MVFRTIASYAAADCPFRQDTHHRMGLVIVHIRCAEERERAKRTQDHEYVNGEKLFGSSSSAQCMEVEYATKRFSESPPPVGTKTDKGEPAAGKRSWDFAQRIQVEHDSSSDKAPTASRVISLLEIHCQIDHNDMLQRRLAHRAKLLHDADSLQSALPSATEAILYLRRFVPLPLFHRLIGS